MITGAFQTNYYLNSTGIPPLAVVDFVAAKISKTSKLKTLFRLTYSRNFYGNGEGWLSRCPASHDLLIVNWWLPLLYINSYIVP